MADQTTRYCSQNFILFYFINMVVKKKTTTKTSSKASSKVSSDSVQRHDKDT
ncbi:MAG: hypothetical protein WCG25_08010 [bacterium]